MADFEENIRKLRAVAAASAAKLTAREFPSVGTPAAAPPPVKRQRTAEMVGPEAEFPEMNRPTFSVVKVPDALIGALIGKGGFGLKHMEGESGAHITVGKLSDGGFRRVCLEGTFVEQAKAQEMIEEFIQMRTAQDAANRVLTSQVVTTEILQVPERFCGSVIGRGGEVIKSVKDHYNIAAKFDKELTISSEYRHLTLRGTAQAVAGAREQIELIILECYRRHGVFNKALEEKYGSSGLAASPQPFLQPMLRAAVGGGGPAEAAPASLVADMEAAGGATATGPRSALRAPAMPPKQGESPAPAAVGAPWQGWLPPAGPAQSLPYPAMNASAAAAQWAAHHEKEVLPWAAYYAADPTCVSYYLQLRAAAEDAAHAMAGAAPPEQLQVAVA